MSISTTNKASTSHKIVVCLGSSCYLRGNQRNTEIVREYLERNGLSAEVELSGSLCSGHCKNGPVVTIDGKLYERVESSELEALLDSLLPSRS
jgi:NADH:ubiquinone oxidoreductase 24 kD subunit